MTENASHTEYLTVPASQAREQHPGLGILLTSGFTGADESLESQDDPLIAELRDDLLRKPFDKRELAEKVRRALDQNG
jgi:hypothetical protein